jgi:ribosome biogenesis protein Nip4
MEKCEFCNNTIISFLKREYDKKFFCGLSCLERWLFFIREEPIDYIKRIIKNIGN